MHVVIPLCGSLESTEDFSDKMSSRVPKRVACAPSRAVYTTVVICNGTFFRSCKNVKAVAKFTLCKGPCLATPCMHKSSMFRFVHCFSCSTPQCSITLNSTTRLWPTTQHIPVTCCEFTYSAVHCIICEL